MKYALCFLALLWLATPNNAFARIELEGRSAATSREERAFLERLEKVLAHTEKRIREIFGLELAGRAVVVRSNESYDLKLAEPEPGAPEKTGVLMINSEIVRDYSTGDLQIACARGLYLMAWPKFRKPFSTANALTERLYVEGMTAYAAELLYPGAPAWQCAGLYGKDGKGLYKQYGPLEKSLAEEVQRTLNAKSARKADDRLLSRTGSALSLIPAGRLLSYRIIKTFEHDMDQKMIQLMDFSEFQERLPAGLEKLRQGFKSGR